MWQGDGTIKDTLHRSNCGPYGFAWPSADGLQLFAEINRMAKQNARALAWRIIRWARHSCNVAEIIYRSDAIKLHVDLFANARASSRAATRGRTTKVRAASGSSATLPSCTGVGCCGRARRRRAYPSQGRCAKPVGVSPRDVSLVGGATARVKRLTIAGDGPTLIVALEKITEPR